MLAHIRMKNIHAQSIRLSHTATHIF